MPAHTADGRIVFGALGFARSGRPDAIGHIGYGGKPSPRRRSHATISSSRPRVLCSYDVKSLAFISEYDWAGGGLSSPAIGPTGCVYARRARWIGLSWRGGSGKPTGGPKAVRRKCRLRHIDRPKQPHAPRLRAGNSGATFSIHCIDGCDACRTK